MICEAENNYWKNMDENHIGTAEEEHWRIHGLMEWSNWGLRYSKRRCQSYDLWSGAMEEQCGCVNGQLDKYAKWKSWKGLH